jgi:hypothetical protein
LKVKELWRLKHGDDSLVAPKISQFDAIFMPVPEEMSEWPEFPAFPEDVCPECLIGIA